jgi:Spy/CpxP family protein refolding chaperone
MRFSHSCCGPRSRRRPEGFDPEGHGWGSFFMRRGRGEGHGHGPGGGEGFDGGGGGFGVRRPLRFLAFKLELDEKQIAELARLLDEVKIERAQAEVDDRRTLSEFADALSGEVFDPVKAASGGDRRVATAQRLRDAVISCIQQLHAILNPEQRAKLAYLIRSGALAM